MILFICSNVLVICILFIYLQLLKRKSILHPRRPKRCLQLEIIYSYLQKQDKQKQRNKTTKTTTTTLLHYPWLSENVLKWFLSNASAVLFVRNHQSGERQGGGEEKNTNFVSLLSSTSKSSCFYSKFTYPCEERTSLRLCPCIAQ